MKDIVTPVPPEEVRQMIKKSLETAALVNYTRLSAEARIEGSLQIVIGIVQSINNTIFVNFAEDLRGELIVPPPKKLEDLIHLAELCVDLLQQNEEHYGEVSYRHHEIRLEIKNQYVWVTQYSLSQCKYNASLHAVFLHIYRNVGVYTQSTLLLRLNVFFLGVV